MRRATPTRRGTAIVEFALIAPLLMLLLAAILDFALLLRTATCVSNAVRVGAEYATGVTPALLDLNTVASQAKQSSPNVPMNATAVKVCKCGDGSTVICPGSCASGSVRIYLQVNAQATAHTVFDYSGLHFSGVTGAQASLRLQ